MLRVVHLLGGGACGVGLVCGGHAVSGGRS